MPDALPGVAAGTWVIDPAHSNVAFAVRHLMSKVRGRFTAFEGQLVIDEDPARSSASVTIDMASVDTGNEMRDNHLRTRDFFDVEQAPKLTFTSTGLRQDGSQWLLTGDLEIRDVTKGVEIELEFLGVDPTGVQGEPRVGFGGRTSIARSDFGIDFGLVEGAKIVVGDKVEIELEIEAFLAG
ncbi:YceI family protein [Amycolatopsis sp. CA-128772]|uniref:YceI family protein n=1 Tax=Amycolatopsis sp. CA-128772 TaxID=2073159 RepID=UPI000CD07162|nr:YceI family protein [Amycolatopsis sp. CA-128772]